MVSKHIDKKPTEIQKICNDQGSYGEINLKTIYNKKSRIAQNNQDGKSENLAQNLKINNEFIRFKISGYGCDEVFILFNDDQIADLKFHCLHVEVIK